MKSNRRSVLIGLGALTVGGGAVFGTGAFSSVEAERSVNIQTTGDGSALLGLSIESDTLSPDTGGDVIEFNTENINLDALTRFENALEITNNSDNADNDSIEVDIYDGEPGALGSSRLRTDDPGSGDDSGIYFVAGSDPITVDQTEPVNVDVVINTLGETDDSTEFTDTVTFEATRQ